MPFTESLFAAAEGSSGGKMLISIGNCFWLAQENISLIAPNCLIAGHNVLH